MSPRRSARRIAPWLPSRRRTTSRRSRSRSRTIRISQRIKEDKRSRVQDTAITAEALLPDGPYDLWKEGETSRRVKDLAGAFAQLPHLPKMLKADAIVDTLGGWLRTGCLRAPSGTP